MVVPELTWTWEPSILIGLAAWVLAYFVLVGRVRKNLGAARVHPARQAAFVLGSLLALVALCSPLDGLGDDYLFSAHMAQHMLLMFGAPPLWLLGIPEWAWQTIYQTRLGRRLVAVVGMPLAAFMLFNAVMWLWHLPTAYDFALEHENVHILEHLSFLLAALIGWAPGLLPAPVNPLSKPARALFLFANTFPCTALAALFTLSGRVLYPFYESAPRIWGMTALADQQLGGLLMWLPGDMILMAAVLVTFALWLAQSDRVERPTPA